MHSESLEPLEKGKSESQGAAAPFGWGAPPGICQPHPRMRNLFPGHPWQAHIRCGLSRHTYTSCFLKVLLNTVIPKQLALLPSLEPGIILCVCSNHATVHSTLDSNWPPPWSSDLHRLQTVSLVLGTTLHKKVTPKLASGLHRTFIIFFILSGFLFCFVFFFWDRVSLCSLGMLSDFGKKEQPTFQKHLYGVPTAPLWYSWCWDQSSGSQLSLVFKWTAR
jgi:hypothetical protein